MIKRIYKFNHNFISRYVLPIMGSAILVWFTGLTSVSAQPLSEAQKEVLQSGILYYNTAQDCNNSSNNNSGNNQPSSPSSIQTLAINYGTGQPSVTVYLPSDGLPHPLVLFAPGQNQTSNNGFYDNYLKRTAAQGFVVAGINFTSNSTIGDIANEVQDINTLVQQLPSNPQLSGKLSGPIGLIGQGYGAIDAIEAGYGVNQISGISAIIEEDGTPPSTETNLPSGLPNSGPPLLLMHGTSDTIQPISSGSDQIWPLVKTSYKAYAKFIGADNFSYITGNPDNIQSPAVNDSQFTPAVDAITGTFLNTFLNGQTSNFSSLSSVAAGYPSQISFQESGNEPSSSTSSSPTSAVCCGTTLSGNGNGIEAYNFLTSKGLSPAGAAGVVGNMTEESSGVDPERLESHFSGEQPAETLTQSELNNGKLGWGIVQWTPPSKIITVSENNGSQASTIDTLSFQLNFLWQELNSSYGNLVSKLKTDKSPQTAATQFLSGFERGNPSPSRQVYAQAYYNLAINNIPLPPNVPVSNNSGGSSSGCGNSGYQNPFHNMTNLGVSRIDQGVDYYAKPGTTVPVYAIGDGTVTLATDKSTFYTTSHGFADWIVYQLASGPAAGKYVYVSEACPPEVQTGQQITSNTVLCEMQPDSIETGWALNATSQAAAAYNAYTNGGYETAYGVNFNQLLMSLGAPGGHLDATSDPGGTVLGTLPPGWPNWSQGN